jgi:hypothetical protein
MPHFDRTALEGDRVPRHDDTDLPAATNRAPDAGPSWTPKFAPHMASAKTGTPLTFGPVAKVDHEKHLETLRIAGERPT